MSEFYLSLVWVFGIPVCPFLRVVGIIGGKIHHVNVLLLRFDNFT